MRPIQGVLLVVGFLLLLACQPVQEQEPVESGQEPIDLGEAAMIFTAEQAEAMQVKPWIEGSVPIEGFWTPEPAQVRALEAALPAFLAEHPERFQRDPPPWESLAAYKAQYLGVIEGGKQLLYGNFFCDAVERSNWQEEMILVEDGGDCFFQVRYDPATGEFTSIQVNGEA